MAKSDDLFDLISSLKSNEKRFFTLHANLTGKGNQGKHYLVLYQRLLAMPEYNAEALLALYLRDFPQLTDKEVRKRLADHKNHLMNLILKVMRSFPSDRSVDILVRDYIHDARLLRGRRIYGLGYKLLQRARKKAWKYERFTLLLEIMRAERKILQEWQKPGYQHEVEQLLASEAEICAHLQLESQLAECVDPLLILTRKTLKARTNEEVALAKQILARPVLSDQAQPQYFQAQSHYYFARAIGNHLLGNLKLAHKSYHNVVLLWEAHPHFIEEEPDIFKISIANFLNACHLIEEYHSFEEYLAKFNCIQDYTLDQKAESFQNANHLDLLFRMNQNDLEAGLAMIPKIKAGLKQFEQKINGARKLTFYHNISIIAWFCGKMDLAIEWNAKIRNFKNTALRKDIQSFAPYLRIILGYELEEEDLFEALAKVRKRFRNKKESEFLNLLGKLLYKIISHPQPTCENWQQVAHALESNISEEALGKREVIIWVQSKLSGKPMRDLL